VKRQWMLAGVAAVMLAAGCSAPVAPVEDVVIGANLELTGPAAAIGKVYAQALQLKVEQVNAEGVLGRRKLTLVVRDNRSDEAASVANVNALLADTSVTALVTGICAECLLAAVKPINDAHVPTISLALPSTVSAPATDRRYVFKLAPNLADDATVLTTEMARTGMKKVALAATDDAYGKEALETMTSKANRLGIVVVAERVSADPDKLAAAADRIVKQKPDAVVVLAFAPLAAQVGKSIREAGHTGALLFGGAAADNLFLTGATASALDGAEMVFTPTLVSDDIIATSPAKATRSAWFRDYLSRYGTYAAFASFAADAIELIVQAINDVNGTNRDALRTAIESSRLDGLSGPIRITPANHSGLMPQAVTMLVASNGRWRLAS
jgi:branched-chain amino acid transport system substrate-binding protein